MPLPVSDPNRQWPPTALDSILPAMGQWGAWWSNSLEALQIAYGGGTTGDKTGFFASDTGGPKVHSIGPIRWFVGEAATGVKRNNKLPVPIAAEICQASADLLFADPITVTVGATDKPTDKPAEDSPTQVRLNTLLGDEFHTTMAEAAEMGAALGGSYLRVTWDDKVNPDGPFSTVKDADEAIPEFAFGRLVAVTFWAVIAREGKHVYRHLERHEISDVTGNGIILHGLYQGEDDKLGTRISLTSRTETQKLAVHADLTAEGTIDTQSEGLAVTYVPNQTPNRLWRKDPLGRNLGRSDLDGVEHLMDQLAETMSDWMRARRAARARIMMSKDLVKSNGPGQGSTVDLDQEVYVGTDFSMGGGPSASPSLADRVQVLQPSFDPAGYKATADQLIEQILQMAGYSMQTFGVHDEGGGDMTATEVESKERRSLMTRSRKIRTWQPALVEHITKLLEVDRVFFGHSNVVSELTVEFSDGVQESQKRLAETVQALFASESASTEERVEILHPDWDDEQKATEVTRIKTEFAKPDPMADPIMTPFDEEPGNGTDEPAAV